jgi:hypothetical protein
MAIAFKKYIDITSAVGGTSTARSRELVGRVFTQNTDIPTQTIIEFTSADEVGAFFGKNSELYKRALFYFSFIGKQTTSPQKLSIASWNSVDTAPRIIGGTGVASLAAFQGLATTAAFDLTIGDDTVVITDIDYSGAATLADVAALLEAGIQDAGALLGTQWTACTVAYNATNNSFDFTGGAVVTAPAPVVISTAPNDASPNYLGTMLKWVGFTDPLAFLPAFAKFSWGYVGESAESPLERSRNNDNNFGSFCYDENLLDEYVLAIATLNDSYNNEFMYSYGVVELDNEEIELICTTLTPYGGTCVTLETSADLPPIIPATTEYAAMLPMAILAATDYNRRDASQNYMFQTANLTAIVQSNSVSDFMDDCRVNYYGATQNAGKLISFYQRGYMLGLPTDALDCNTYANEIWLKDRIGVALMRLFLVLGKISANRQGRATILSAIQETMNEALFNGVVSVGKLLNNEQKQFITATTGSPDAWRQVQDSGYWLDCIIEQDANLDFVAKYILIYSKDDAIRKIEGSDILI